MTVTKKTCAIDSGKTKASLNELTDYVRVQPDATDLASVYASRSNKHRNILLSVSMFILVMEMAERLCYYGINQGLKNFMTDKLGWTQVSANSLKSSWTSTCYLSTVFGAWLADEKFGRFKVIVMLGLWYVVGDLLIALAAHPSMLATKSASNPIFVLGLFFGIAVGTGAIKSNVVTFGADQFNPMNPEQAKQKELYFSTFYMCINVGACFSYGYLSIICIEGAPGIPKEYGYFALFSICAGVMLLALLIFLMGTSRYVHLPRSERAFTALVSTLYQSARQSKGGKAICGGLAIFVASFLVTTVAALTASSKESSINIILTLVGGGLTFVGMTCWLVYGRNPVYMDQSKQSNGGSIMDHTVDEIKSVVRALPFAAFLIMWWCCYDQIDANFQSIVQQCDLRISLTDDKQIPGPMVGLFDPVAVIVMIPVLDYIIYPSWKKMTGRRPSPFGKVLAGLIIAVFAMIWTGFLEKIRRSAPDILITNEFGQRLPMLASGGGQPMKQFRWYYTIPQYLFIGTAEALINVTAYDIFYSNVPVSLRSTCQSINCFVAAMGANATAIFTLAFQSYIQNDLNKSHLEYMFFTVAAVASINIVLYVKVMISMQFGMGAPKEQLNTNEKNDMRDVKV